MAPIYEGDPSRQYVEDERPSRGRGRGPSRRRDWAEQQWGPAWSFHHHHHHHDHDDGSDHPGRGGGRRRERFGDDEFSQATRRLIGALRAAGQDGGALRQAAVAVMDEATRAIYRLLADGAEAPTDEKSAEAAPGPQPGAAQASGPSVL